MNRRLRHFQFPTTSATRPRAVLDLTKRKTSADRVASSLPMFPKQPVDGADSVYRGLEQDGYAMTPGFVTPEMAADIRGYFSDKTCEDPYHPERGRFTPPRDFPKGVHVAYFDAGLIVRAPHIFRIFNNPVVLSAVSRVLGAKPTIAYMTAWWSLPAGDGTAQQAENFHRDVDDWRFVKYFTYPTDVDAGSGPHIFIRGSHNQNKLTKIRRYEEDEIAEAFGPESKVVFEGPAGTSFLENTYGFHRGLPADIKPRLALAATYSLRPIPYGPKAPVAKVGRDGVPADIDPYINRVYCEPA